MNIFSIFYYIFMCITLVTLYFKKKDDFMFFPEIKLMTKMIPICIGVGVLLRAIIKGTIHEMAIPILVLLIAGIISFAIMKVIDNIPNKGGKKYVSKKRNREEG